MSSFNHTVLQQWYMQLFRFCSSQYQNCVFSFCWPQYKDNIVETNNLNHQQLFRRHKSANLITFDAVWVLCWKFMFWKSPKKVPTNWAKSWKNIRTKKKNVPDRSIVLQILGSPHWQAGICSWEGEELIFLEYCKYFDLIKRFRVVIIMEKGIEISTTAIKFHLKRFPTVRRSTWDLLSSHLWTASVDTVENIRHCKEIIIITVTIMQKSDWFWCWLGHLLVLWTVECASELVKASWEPSSTKVVPAIPVV